MGGVSGLGGAAALLGVEVCAPLFLLCWLCCWPDDASSDKSSELQLQLQPAEVNGRERRGAGSPARRRGSSAASLHLPSGSGSGVRKQQLSAHRSHEEIRSRRRSQLEAREDAARYHSAPSVIDEVLHRRDWESSAKRLHARSDEQVVGKPCKKHYANIKSSRRGAQPADAAEASRKELTALETKDEDASELAPRGAADFRTGGAAGAREDSAEELEALLAKDIKQSLNESLKSRERPGPALGPLSELQVSGAFGAEEAPGVDRSGAVHQLDEPRRSYCDTPSVPYPPLSAEPPTPPVEPMEPEAGARGACGGALRARRARHASAGDVLAPLLRPHSAALSESDLDLELECCDEPPPAYEELHALAGAHSKETAI